MDREYLYTECGLDNVVIRNMHVQVDETGEEVYAIPNVVGLHRVLHRVMDVVFGEDDCRVRRRNGPANFATLRRLAQNLLQRAPAGASLRVQRKRAGWDHGFLQQVLTAP